MPTSSDELRTKTCEPCEGGVEPLSPDAAETLLAVLPGWSISANGKRITKTWMLDDFVSCVERTQQICEVAERDAHHPDVHIEQYRNLRTEIWTHAIGGLSENDFILAAKIDALF